MPQQKTVNPIIFARTETTHIPVALEEAEKRTPLRDAIYSADPSGNLKVTPMPPISEREEEEKELITLPSPPKRSVPVNYCSLIP